MRSYLLLACCTVSLLIFNCKLYAQNCVRQISTNPKKPFNAEWTQMFPGLRESFVNTGFDWSPHQGTIPIYKTQNWITPFPSQSGVINMWSPFEVSNGSSTMHLQSAGNGSQAFDDLDWHWEDGWELLYMNLGYLPNGDLIDDKPNNSWRGVEDPTPSNAPYFVLYNRYRGVIRIFANVWFTDIGSFDYVNIRLGFFQEEKVSGALRHVGGVDRALDQKTINSALLTSRSHPGSSGIPNHNQWMVAEFQTAYDPCQCKVRSQFQFEFQATDTFDIDLEMRSVSLEKNINKLNYNDKNFLQWNNGQPGNVIYRSMDELLKQYKEALAKYNNELNDFNSPLNSVKQQLVDVAGTALSDGVANLAVPIGGLKHYILTNKNKLWRGNNNIIAQDSNQAETWAVDVKNALKGALANEFEYLNTVVDIQEKPVSPQVPVATFTEGRLKGSITNHAIFRSPFLYAPGTMGTASGTSKEQISSFNYPAYNNVLGQFAMLTTPTLKAHTTHKGWGNCVHTQHTCKKGLVHDVLSVNNQYYFQLENVSYALNPALDFDMEKTRVLGALKLKLEVSNGDKKYIERLFKNTNFNVLHQIRRNGKFEIELISEYHNMEDIQNVLFGFETITRSEYARHYNGRNTCKPQVVTEANVMNRIESRERFLSIWCDQLQEAIVQIDLKVMADMYFDQIGSNGKQVNTFQSFTYRLFESGERDVYDDFIKADFVTKGNPQSFAKYIPGTVYLSGTIGPTHHLIAEVNGNTLIVNAEKVVVSGTLASASGYTLRVKAKEEIELVHGANVGPDVELLTADFYQNPKVIWANLTGGFLENYCFKKYKANQVVNKRTANPNETLRSATQPVRPLFKVYPNPASNELNIVSRKGAYESCKIVLTNLNGQVVMNEWATDGLANAFALDVTALKNGYYLLTIKTNTGAVFREKVIISK